MKELFYCVLPLVLCGYSFNLSAQDLMYGGPVSTSLAGIRSLDCSHWATHNNASLLAWEEQFTIAAAYQIRFNLHELSSRSLSGIVPFKYGVLSALLMQNGFSKSLYNRYALSYSRRFGQLTSAFFQYSYFEHRVALAEPGHTFYASLGFNHRISSSLQMGLFIQNPEQASVSYVGVSYPLPSLYAIGLKWNSGKAVAVFVEAEKELHHDPVYKAALQFGFMDRLFVRSGVKGKPVEFTFGGGFIIAELSIDVGFLYHQQLGISSGIGLSYSINSARK